MIIIIIVLLLKTMAIEEYNKNHQIFEMIRVEN